MGTKVPRQNIVERLRDWHQDVTRQGQFVGQDVEAQKRTSERVQMIEDAANAIEELQSALDDAWSDIGQWVRLAENQREAMPHNSPYCPTASGIAMSEKIRERISEVLRKIAADS